MLAFGLLECGDEEFPLGKSGGGGCVEPLGHLGWVLFLDGIGENDLMIDLNLICRLLLLLLFGVLVAQE